MLYNPEKKDYSIPYKTFNDLKNGDKIFVIDYKSLEIIEYEISDYENKKSNDYYKVNCIEVSFRIPALENYNIMRIYNGNTFIFKTSYNYKDLFICTDKRICEVIIDLLHSRNNYQWSCFSEIFGHPLAGKFESRHIVIK